MGSVLTDWVAGLHREGRTLVSFDPNVWPGLVEDLAGYRQGIDDIVACCDLVKASDEDLDVLYPGADPAAAAERWLEGGADVVVITEGSRGAEAFHRKGAQARSSPPAFIRQASADGVLGNLRVRSKRFPTSLDQRTNHQQGPSHA